MMTRLTANVSLTLALCLPAAGGDASLAAGEGDMVRLGRTATLTRSASEGEEREDAAPRWRFGLVWTTGICCNFSGTGDSRTQAAGDRVAVDRDPSDRAGGATVRWITFPDERLQVCGLPWLEENGPHWWRLPKRAAEKLPPAVARLMRFPTGARIRFSSDTSRLQIRLKASPTLSFGHMSPIGSRGLDAYVDRTYWSSATVTQEGEQELTFFQGAEGGPKEICIYLPSFQEVTVLAVGVDAGAEVGPPAPFAERLPIVFYGSSIAQGACASRPGMSYEAILARRLDADYVNLGFSGSGKAEPEVVELVSRVEACCYVFDLGKSYRTQPADVYAEMLRKIRADHSGVPIVCVTPIFSTRELYDTGYAELSEYVRRAVATAAGQRIESGDREVQLIDGLELLGPADADAFQEGVHPSDLGFALVADRLEPTLRKILRVPR